MFLAGKIRIDDLIAMIGMYHSKQGCAYCIYASAHINKYLQRISNFFNTKFSEIFCFYNQVCEMLHGNSWRNWADVKISFL